MAGDCGVHGGGRPCLYARVVLAHACSASRKRSSWVGGGASPRRTNRANPGGKPGWLGTEANPRWSGCPAGWPSGTRPAKTQSACAESWSWTPPPAKPGPRPAFATDTGLTPEWIVEVTFEESRRHLGVEAQRQWLAIARTTSALMGLFSLVCLMAWWKMEPCRSGRPLGTQRPTRLFLTCGPSSAAPYGHSSISSTPNPAASGWNYRHAIAWFC